MHIAEYYFFFINEDHKLRKSKQPTLSFLRDNRLKYVFLSSCECNNHGNGVIPHIPTIAVKYQKNDFVLCISLSR